jgi:hypothetical protein
VRALDRAGEAGGADGKRLLALPIRGACFSSVGIVVTARAGIDLDPE